MDFPPVQYIITVLLVGGRCKSELKARVGSELKACGFRESPAA